MQARQASHYEIQKITKEFHSYKISTKREMRLLNMKIAKLQKMLEKSVIPEDNPDNYEIKAIKYFESTKKKAASQFVPLDL